MTIKFSKQSSDDSKCCNCAIKNEIFKYMQRNPFVKMIFNFEQICEICTSLVKSIQRDNTTRIWPLENKIFGSQLISLPLPRWNIIHIDLLLSYIGKHDSRWETLASFTLGWNWSKAGWLAMCHTFLANNCESEERFLY